MSQQFRSNVAQAAPLPYTWVVQTRPFIHHTADGRIRRYGIGERVIMRRNPHVPMPTVPAGTDDGGNEASGIALSPVRMRALPKTGHRWRTRQRA